MCVGHVAVTGNGQTFDIYIYIFEMKEEVELTDLDSHRHVFLL